MKQSPDQLAQQYSMTLCQGHDEALQEALQDIQLRAMGWDDYTVTKDTMFEESHVLALVS
jgi:hypothetical protein